MSSKKVSKYSKCTVSEFALDKNKPKPLGITCKSITPKKENQTLRNELNTCVERKN